MANDTAAARAALEKVIADAEAGSVDQVIADARAGLESLDQETAPADSAPDEPPAPTLEPASVDNTVAAADNTASSSSVQDGEPVTAASSPAEVADDQGAAAPGEPAAASPDGEPAPQGEDHRESDAIALLEQAIAILSQ